MQTPTSTSPAGFHAVLGRMALPFLLFTAVLFGLLALSWLLLLPQVTSFPVGGSLLPASALQQREKELLADIAAVEAKRDALVFPVADAVYTVLTEQKRAVIQPDALLKTLTVTGQEAAEKEGVVRIDRVAIDTVSRKVTLAGDVHNTGPSSMTVLARFVEMVEALPFVSDLQAPSFIREGEGGHIHSPFTFVFTLTDEAS